MNILLALACLAAFAWLAMLGDSQDAQEGPCVPPGRPQDNQGDWNPADAFRPNSGRFGWMLGPGARVEVKDERK